MSIQIIDRCESDDSSIQKGYIFHGDCTLGQPGKVYFGGSFEKGNILRSYLNLIPINGPVHGCLIFTNSEGENVPVYNYLTSLIPGLFPRISGPYSPQNGENFYNLSEIQSQGQLCKVLGLGSGSIASFKVATPEKEVCSTLSENFNLQNTQFVAVAIGNLGVFGRTSIIKQLNYSNITSNFVYPLTQTGANFYMQGFDWLSTYGINTINGTNDFPTFSWGGGRQGSLTPRSLQFKSNVSFNYPSTYLENELNTSPVGYVYAGQGLQLINATEGEGTTVQPYQQGRGIIEYLSREARYSNGVPDFIDISSTYPPEGIVPGRNNAFVGVALTDYLKRTINIVNLESTSTTPQDTRKQIGSVTRAAHNAPLVYFPNSPEVNSYNPLPWNSLFAYTSDGANGGNKVPILREGITTMIISGAYPLYRGAHATEFSGYCRPSLGNVSLRGFRYFGRYFSQYYITNEFWKANETDTEPTPELVFPLPVPPNSPYIIKGGRIILYSGQKVLAGSYVYSTIGLVGNVNISKFFGPSAKEILLNSGERDYLIQNLYGKYQSNQGGLIVIAVGTEGSAGAMPPPPPPPACQPIGIILEDIEGFGTPQIANLQTTYTKQTDISSDLQTVPDFENTYQLQNREVLVQIFPMYANQSLSGFPSTYRILRRTGGQPSLSGVGTDYLLDSVAYTLPPQPEITLPASPMNARIRTLYTIQDGKYAYNYFYRIADFSLLQQEDLNIYTSLKDKQISQDWPSPQYFSFASNNYF